MGPVTFRSNRVPEPGVFLQMDAAKAKARANGVDVVDLSVGSSDMEPPHEVRATLKEAADDPSTFNYCLKSKTMPFLDAATTWYASRFGVKLDPSTEALSLIGAQEGLAHLLMAVADPSDKILLCDVAYPSYWGALKVASLEPTMMPLGPDLLPDVDAVSAADATSARAILLNYPNNPTGAMADEAFWNKVLAFAERNDLLVIHDNPYLDQVFPGEPAAVSPLSLPKARERCVEIFSFAKGYHMGGCRLGFILGNSDAISSLEALKGPVDFNQYLGIQRMGITALSLPEDRLKEAAGKWQQRALTMAEALKPAGWTIPAPRACMYLWCKLPEGTNELEFCMRAVAEAGVAFAPGRGFGPGGIGYVRIALVASEDILKESAQRVVDLLATRA